jgi:hypothetical protein
MVARNKLVRAGAAIAAAGATVILALAGTAPAQADPIQYTNPILGFGSDTTQDVINAFAGFSNGNRYVPLQSEASDGSLFQMVSWDAFPANTCIGPKVGGPSILRPNGSSNGQRILSAAATGAAWPLTSTTFCGGQQNVAGMVDFARSSSGPGSLANANGPLAWIPFGRDALAFGYLRPSGSPVTSLTSAQLVSLHSSGPQLIGSVPVIACGIQTGSGTYNSWMTMLGLPTNGTGDPGTSTCNNAGNVPDLGGRLQENNGPELTLKGNVLSSMQHAICDGVAGGSPVPCTNAQLVVGFSASQFIARSNGVGSPDPALGANGGLGAINGNAAVSGTAPNLQPVAAAYNNATFGRDVYNVVTYESIDTANFTDLPHIVDMFVGAGSSVCQASATIQQHGYLTISNCGATNVRGNFRLS